MIGANYAAQNIDTTTYTKSQTEVKTIASLPNV